MVEQIVKIRTVGAFSIVRFAIHNWFWIILFLVLLPSIISSISQAKKESNPSLPFIQLGTRLVGADNVIYKDVQTLQENPSSLVGMEKPQIGIWAKFKYYWYFFFRVIWSFLGNIWLIFVPFIVFFKIFKTKQTSTPAHNFLSSIIAGLVFIFIINLVLLTHGLIKGNILIDLPKDVNFYQETWWITKMTLPFHGLVNLGHYLYTLI